MNARKSYLPLLALLVALAALLLVAGCPRAAHACVAGEGPQEGPPAPIAALSAAFRGAAAGCAAVLGWWAVRRKR